MWHQDDELRKQIEQCADCMIITGQEAPPGGRKLREDLFKKTMSADGIAGRKPYGFTTRMLQCEGWKRLEVNKLIRFVGVTEENFNSILRRALVWKPKARFYDAAYLQKHYPDHELDGIFCKDPALKKVLQSGPAVLAGLRIQHGFELKYSKERCREIIETYASLGGDCGLTEDKMRLACGLELRQRQDAQVSGGLDQLCGASQEAADGMKQGLRKVADGIMDECLSKCKDGCTFGMFRYYALPAGSPNLDRETMWKQLETHKFMVPHDIKGKAKVALMPYIATAQSFGSLCDQKGDETVASFPETYATQSLRHYLHRNPSREHNVQMLLQFFKTACVIKRGAKGRRKSLTQSRLDAAKAASERLEASEDLARGLLGVCEQSTASDRDMTKSPGRRRRGKSAPAADDETDITCMSASSHTASAHPGGDVPLHA